MSVDVKVSRLHRFDDEKKTLRAFADIEINGLLLVKGVQVVKGKNGLFVSMPRKKGKDSKWYEIIRPLTDDVKEQIVSTILGAYQSGA